MKAGGAGALCVWLTATVENCTINVTLSGTATADYYAGIAFDCSQSILKNITVKSTSALSAYKSGAASVEENVKFEQIA